MKAGIFVAAALIMLPTVALAVDAGNTSGKTNETTPTMESNKMLKQDDAKGAATAREPAGKVTTPTNSDGAGQSPKTKTP
jgi:hypothetical protein